MYGKILAKQKGHYLAGNNQAWLLATHLGDPAGAFEVLRGMRKGRFSGKPLPGDRLRPEFLDTIGAVYHKLGKPELFGEMRELFEAARRRYPQDPRMCLYLGHACAGLGDADRAGDLFTTAIDLAGPKGQSTLSQPERQEVIDGARAALTRLERAARN